MGVKKDEYGNLIEPTMPGAVDKSAVNNAWQGVTAAKSALNNMSYDNFKQGSVYQGLKKDYSQQGQQAMKDTIGQVAARTGGMASSYATSAANQSYNNYMRQLEDVARSMYNDEYSRARDKVNMAQQDYSNAYGEYRDRVGDSWTRYNAEYDSYWDTKDHEYKVGRDTKADNDKAKAEEIDMLSSDAYYGNQLSWTDYQQNHPESQLTQNEYNSIVNAAKGKYVEEHRTDKDTELEGIFGAEGFTWGDWDGDGNVEDGTEDKTFEDLYGGSSYDEAYWKAFWDKAQAGYDEEDRAAAEEDRAAAEEEVIKMLEAGGEPSNDLLIKAGLLDKITSTKEGNEPTYDTDGDGIPNGLKSALVQTMWENNKKAESDKTTAAAVADIEARIANGQSLEEIKAAYGTKNDDGTYELDWKDVTGKTEAQWQKVVNDNTVKGYAYPRTADGANNILSALANSASLSLNEKNQGNFDYIFGEGAYKAVQDAISDIEGVRAPRVKYDSVQGTYRREVQDSPAEEAVDEIIDKLLSSIPEITMDQIIAVLKKSNPDAIAYYLTS